MDIYSTLTRSKENFDTINKNRVNLFVCGPTVYDDAHIGHGRTYISFDTIKRYLEYSGYAVFYEGIPYPPDPTQHPQPEGYRNSLHP